MVRKAPGEYGPCEGPDAEEFRTFALASLTVIASILSFVMVTLASSKYKLGSEQDIMDLFTHWENERIIDIILVDFQSTTQCPTGYSEGKAHKTFTYDRTATQTVGIWFGSFAWCECAEDGFEYTYQVDEWRCYCGRSGESCGRYNCGDQSCESCSYTTEWGTGYCSYESERDGCNSESRPKDVTEIYFTQKGECDTNRINAGCVTQPAFEQVPLRSWKKHRICYKRGGWSAVERHTSSCF